MIAAAGLSGRAARPDPYAFLSERAVSACDRYGVKSVSVLAVAPSQGGQ
jgi:hypothetical protein